MREISDDEIETLLRRSMAAVGRPAAELPEHGSEGMSKLIATMRRAGEMGEQHKSLIRAMRASDKDHAPIRFLESAKDRRIAELETDLHDLQARVVQIEHRLDAIEKKLLH